ncbi:MAG: hypothetical protein AB1733_03615 [Thermodesulfobacteriota bacterium]
MTVMGKLSAVKTREHAAALRERDRFLSEHPELRGFQRDIDEMLGSAGSDHNRLVLIHNLMMDAVRKLDDQLHSLLRVGQ